MAIAVSTLGATFSYAVEQTAGTRPTTASSYTAIAGIKSISGLAGEPSTLDCTPLDETHRKKSITGLQDASIASVTANNTDTFQTAWAGCVTAAEALTGGKQMWFEVKLPGLAKAFYFAGTPKTFDTLEDVEVDAVADAVTYISVEDIEGWSTKSA